MSQGHWHYCWTQLRGLCDGVLVVVLVALIKCLKKKNLQRRDDLFWLTVQGYSPSGQQEPGVAGHTAIAVRKQRKMNVNAHLAFPTVFSPGP